MLLRNLNAQLLLEPELYSIFDVSFREPVDRVLLKTPLRFCPTSFRSHSGETRKRTQLGDINLTIGVHESGKVPVQNDATAIFSFVFSISRRDRSGSHQRGTLECKPFILRLNDRLPPNAMARIVFLMTWRSPATTNTDLVGGP